MPSVAESRLNSSQPNQQSLFGATILPHVKMRSSSEDCSSSSSDAPPKELFGNGDGESENLLASLNQFAPMRERKGKQWLKSVKAILVPINIVFLVANALGWLVMATRQPASFTPPQIASPCKVPSCLSWTIPWHATGGEPDTLGQKLT